MKNINEMKKFNKIIQVVGVPGSGKNYLMDRLIQKDTKRKYISFSQIMMQSTKSLGRNVNEDEFRNLDRELREKMVKASLEFVLTNQPIVLSTHTIYKNERGLFEINYDSEFILRCKGYIHLISPIEQIIDRVRKDHKSGSRKRIYSVGEVDFMQKISVEVTRQLAEKVRSKFFIIENNGENKIEDAVDKMYSIIDNLI